MNADCDVVVFHASGDIEIDGRIDPNGITEVNSAAFKLILRAREGCAAVCDADGTQDGRLSNGAAHSQVDRSRKLRIRVLKVELWRACNVHVQANLVAERGWIRRRGNTSRARKGGEVHILSNAEPS